MCTKNAKLFALDKYYLLSQANVLSRGLIGGTTVTNDAGLDGAVVYVTSPIYKQRFNLATGQCLSDKGVTLATYHVELNAILEGNHVMINYVQLWRLSL